MSPLKIKIMYAILISVIVVSLWTMVEVSMCVYFLGF